MPAAKAPAPKVTTNALEWLKKVVDVNLRREFVLAAFHRRQFDLLWTFAIPGSDTEQTEQLWLLRAAAFALTPQPFAAREAELRTHFQPPGQTYWHDLGQYMMTMRSDEEVVRLESNPLSKFPVLYFRALKAIADHRFAEAAPLLLRVLTEGKPGMSEYQWALETLTVWTDREKSLAILSSEGIY